MFRPMKFGLSLGRKKSVAFAATIPRLAIATHSSQWKRTRNSCSMSPSVAVTRGTTRVFIEGLRIATSGRLQITTDGFAPYRSAISNTLEDRVDFAHLIKVYRATPEGERRYSPAEVVSTEIVPCVGNPDPERICTSHIERPNLSIRMGLRRFTRLTNAFSKSFKHHCAALMVWFAFYNLCRVHRSLRCTPAMAAGIADHIWSVRELLEAA
jgi:hypothetical protein